MTGKGGCTSVDAIGSVGRAVCFYSRIVISEIAVVFSLRFIIEKARFIVVTQLTGDDLEIHDNVYNESLPGGPSYGCIFVKMMRVQ